VVVSHDAHYIFGESGAVSEMICTIRIRATSPSVCLYYAGFTYLTDQHRGVLLVEPITGGTIGDLRESATGSIVLYLLLDQDLSPDDPDAYSLTFRIRIRSDVRAVPRLRYFADTGNERLVLRASFPPAASPSMIWWFAAADVVDAENGTLNRQLHAESAGGFERIFDDLIPGWCYGFAWNW
jgi:hypothetical protein